jgi:hypothetical protein
MLKFHEDSNYATKSNEKWQKIVYLCFMIHLNFPDSLKVPFLWRKNLKWDQLFGMDYFFAVCNKIMALVM